MRDPTMTEYPNTARSDDPRLRVLPLQCIELPDGVLLVRGCTEVKISGEGAAEALQIVLTATAGEGMTREELLGLFGALDRPGVEQLVEILAARRLLVRADAFAVPPPNGETGQEVFYWEFGERAEAVVGRLDKSRIAILGVNCISGQLARALAQCGFASVTVVDFPLLRNQRLFREETLAASEWSGPPPLPLDVWEAQIEEERPACLVATADFSGQLLLHYWNEWCVEHGCNFLPVLLDKAIGYVGPLVVPGETACYECLRARENAHFENPDLRRASEALSAVLQRPTLHGFLPPMASVLGDLAAMELTKFHGGVMNFRAGTLLEVNLLGPEMRARKVLKVPRCGVCSSLNRQAAVNPHKVSFLPGEYLARAMSR
jgi:molybdopterin-synthase adenylyltransferase